MEKRIRRVRAHHHRNRGFPVKLGFCWRKSQAAGSMHHKLATAEVQTCIVSDSGNLKQAEKNENTTSVDSVSLVSFAYQV